MSLTISKKVLWVSLLFGFIWCNYFNQAMLFAVGGSVVMLIELAIIFLIWASPNDRTDYIEIRHNYRNLMGAMLAFFGVYIIVFILGADGTSKVSVPFINVTIPKQIYNAFFTCLFLFGMTISIVKMNAKQRHQVSNVLLFILFTVALFNIIAVVKNPNLTKSETYDEEGSVFTLGYSFAYVLAVLFPILVSRYRQKGSKKLLWLSMLVVFVLSIYLAGYFIAITAIILSLLVQWMLSIKKRAVMYLCLGITLCAVFYLTFTDTLQGLLLWLADQSDVDIISRRLREIVEYMNMGMSSVGSDKTTYRFFLYQDTWNHFLDHPILGNYIFGILDGSYDHATLLDLLSCGGVVLGGLFIFFLSRGYKLGCCCLSRLESQRTLLSCYVTYIYLTLINSVLSYRLLGILFVVAPLLLAEGETREEVVDGENTTGSSLRFMGRRRR